MNEQQRTIVVTGVSTGIGWGAAKVLTRAGYRVFGSVRHDADGERLRAELGANFTSLKFDVTDEKPCAPARQSFATRLAGKS